MIPAQPFYADTVSVVPISAETQRMLIAIANGRRADLVVAELVEERYRTLRPTDTSHPHDGSTP